jgi:subtilisin family serine protease
VSRRVLAVVAAAVAGALLVAGAPVAAAPSPQGASIAREFATAAANQDEAAVGQAIADRLLVTFRADTPVEEAQGILDAAGLDASVVPGFDVQVVDVDPARAEQAAIALAAAPQVASVQPDRKLEFVTASDPRRGEQWWWRNVGQQARNEQRQFQQGRPGMDIGALSAGRANRGGGVLVAIVDTGIDVHHPDLRDNLWVNPRPGSFPGYRCAGDRHGCNFTGHGPSGTVYASATEDAHGTHVAGIVAAAENGIGTVGVAPQARVLSAKFLRGSQGAVSGGILALQYAVHAGADVINASWGVPGRVTAQQFERCGREPSGSDCALAAIERTIRDAGIPVVVAAGNQGVQTWETCQRGNLEEVPTYPANSTLPNVITVTAIDNRGEVPCFATTSPRLVDVAAPGVGILSTLPERQYGLLDGSSQAAPAVTGAVAIAIAASGVRDGARLADAVRAGARPYGYLSHPSRPSGLTRAGLASAPGTLQALNVDVGACRSGARRAPFPDRHHAGVHAPNLDCIVQHGLAGGFADGTFRPMRTVTRGQVATLLAGLVRTARDLPAPSSRRFRDLAGDVHADNIEALAALGIVDGHPDGTYRSKAPVTREQFASLLVRTYEHLSEGRIRPVGHHFPDVSGVHERNIRAGAQVGFVEGRAGGRFAPRNEVTRAQMTSFLRRALDKLVNDRISTVR